MGHRVNSTALGPAASTSQGEPRTPAKGQRPRSLSFERRRRPRRRGGSCEHRRQPCVVVKYALAHLLLLPSAPAQAFVRSIPLAPSRSSYKRHARWHPNRVGRHDAIKGTHALIPRAGSRADGSVGGGSRGSKRSLQAPELSITTFNVLAPIFKRMGSGRESEFRDTYLERQSQILDHLKVLRSDVICLQELWLAEQEIVDLYERSLEGYRMYALPRTESRGDGVACFVREDIQVLDRQDIRLKGVGGRVALILRLSVGGAPGEGGARREVVVANTHLLFPHARAFLILRIREVQKLLAFIECYTQVHDLEHLPVILCGDFNGDSSGRVYQHLTDRGFRCSYEDALGADGDRSRWITHVNHLGEEVGVDYVWYRNPGAGVSSMEPKWESIVYQSTKRRLLDSYPGKVPSMKRDELKIGSSEAAAAAAAEAAAAMSARERKGVRNEDDRLSEACQLLGLSEGFELNEDELKLLLDSSADDFDFLVPTILDGSSTGLEGASGGRSSRSERSRNLNRPGGSILEIAASRIWPSSLEDGIWPPDYNVSDHGSLTAWFRVASPPSGSTGGLDVPASVETSTATETAGSAEFAGVNATEARNWGVGDESHYGLR